jgi:hypothetical protein
VKGRHDRELDPLVASTFPIVIVRCAELELREGLP